MLFSTDESKGFNIDMWSHTGIEYTRFGDRVSTLIPQPPTSCKRSLRKAWMLEPALQSSALNDQSCVLFFNSMFSVYIHPSVDVNHDMSMIQYNVHNDSSTVTTMIVILLHSFPLSFDTSSHQMEGLRLRMDRVQTQGIPALRLSQPQKFRSKRVGIWIVLSSSSSQCFFPQRSSIVLGSSVHRSCKISHKKWHNRFPKPFSFPTLTWKFPKPLAYPKRLV